MPFSPGRSDVTFPNCSAPLQAPPWGTPPAHSSPTSGGPSRGERGERDGETTLGCQEQAAGLLPAPGSRQEERGRSRGLSHLAAPDRGAASPSFLGGAQGWKASPGEGRGLQGAVAGQPPSPLLKQILDSTGSSSQGWEKLVRGKYLPGTGGARLASTSGHRPPNTSPARRGTLAPRSRPLQGLLMPSIPPGRAASQGQGVPGGQRCDGRPLAPRIQRGLPFPGAA